MGLLSIGTPFPWDQAVKYADFVREQGLIQFMNAYNLGTSRNGDESLWGDEVEYMIVCIDPSKKLARLHLCVETLIPKLEELSNEALWRPEYARYMLEGTPNLPYKSNFEDYLQVEKSMKKRRQLASSVLEKNNMSLICITSFPMLGVENFLTIDYEKNGPVAKSLFLPDCLTNIHARFPTLTANIRLRRGSKVAINIPIFKDINTKPLNLPDNISTPKQAKQGHIYMDAMGFGMGCSCLQTTIQTSDIDKARRLYDALVPLSPIMLALTAGAPIFKGILADIDCRWTVISQSVDCRTEEERGLKKSTESKYRIDKSRYDSVSCYISNNKHFKPEYNDLNLTYNKEYYSTLINNGIDDLLAKHIAHLFIRDPLVIFEELLEQNKNSMDHFENIQSTNWQTVRFKPPPPSSEQLGWRVEFRPMEIMITDFENAAFSVFTVLLSQTILYFDLNIYIPISNVDKNMEIAHKKDAVINEKFYFRKDLESAAHNDNIEMMSINQIINGNTEFIGLIPLINKYLDSHSIEPNIKKKIDNYLNLVSMRASGELMTTARFIRKFVTNHKDYKKDSRINHNINYDLINLIKNIGDGNIEDAEGLLHPSLFNELSI